MLRSLRSLVLVACIGFAAAAVSAWTFTREVAAVAWRWAVDVSPISLKAAVTAFRPLVQMVQAMAFTAKLAKRDRPTVMARWRMCPSI